MAMSKKDLFETKEVELSLISKALGHPARIRIIKLLLNKNHQTCQEIVDSLPLAQSTVSQHLSELRHSNLVTAKTEGTKVIYSIDKSYLQQSQKLFSDLFYTNVFTQQKLF